MEYKIININDINKAEILIFYNNINSSKKIKIDKIRNKKRKIQSVLGEYLLKELLKIYNISYSNINYIYNEEGKPYIKDYNIYFNISHSHDYVITVISNKEIGVDIEKIRKTNISIINRICTNKEKEYVLSSNIDIEKRLFEIFTLKEAYFKMKGLNLNNLKSVEFIISNNNVTCNDNSINIKLLHIINDYIISIIEKK